MGRLSSAERCRSTNRMHPRFSPRDYQVVYVVEISTSHYIEVIAKSGRDNRHGMFGGGGRVATCISKNKTNKRSYVTKVPNSIFRMKYL